MDESNVCIKCTKIKNNYCVYKEYVKRKGGMFWLLHSLDYNEAVRNIVIRNAGILNYNGIREKHKDRLE